MASVTLPEPLPVLTVTVQFCPEPPTPVIEGLVTPPELSAKSAESTPVTDSLKRTLNTTDEAFVGVAPARVIEVTVGAILSMFVGALLKLPFPAPVPASRLPKLSTIESLSTRFSWIEPDPVPVPTVTVHVAFDPETPETEAPEMPGVVSVKSEASTAFSYTKCPDAQWS